MNLQDAVVSLINQELDIREKDWIRHAEKLMNVGFRIGGEKNFTCHKIKQMRKILDIPQHIADTYLNSLDYTSEKCPICLDVLNDRTNTKLTNCGHLFCMSCYDKLVEKKMCECPVCMNPNMILDRDTWYAEQQKYVDREATDTEDENDNFGFELEGSDH